MAESVVGLVVEKIQSLLAGEAKFLWGLEGQVRDIQKELQRIHCFLKDADARLEQNEIVRNWVSEIRDISHDAEDIIETFALRVLSRKRQRSESLPKIYNCISTVFAHVEACKIGSKIEDLKSKISGLTASLQSYGIKPVKEGESLSSPRSRLWVKPKQYAHVEEEFVGMEDSIKQVVEAVLKEGSLHRVVSICGMGGLGKTTLAKKIFTHVEVRNNFECFAWACISQQFEVKDVLIGILMKLIPERRKKILEMREDELFESLYRIQEEKRCLVVLDDIWTTEAWDCLKAAFPTKETRSKVIITTRNIRIAKYMDPHGIVHELRCLSEAESWELLKRRGFPDLADFDINIDMASLGMKMLQKCGGLPLAIIVLGGFLAEKKSPAEWTTVCSNVNLHLKSGASEVSRVFALSYDDLPYHLKPCFLYMSNFPEDVGVRTRKLIQMWIAESFLAHENKYERVEDVAYSYLNELVNRGLVQAGRRKPNGRIRTCRLHDLIRDLCISRAREESLLHVIDLRKVNQASFYGESSAMSTQKIRRLAVYLNEDVEGYEPSESERNLPLQTLLFFDPKGGHQRSWEQMDSFLVTYKLLRVLDFEGLYSEGYLPKSIGALLHLRYLNLRSTKVQELPSSIGNLECMETLDLRVVAGVQVLISNVLWKMKKLKNLYLPRQFSMNTMEKLRLDGLMSLKILKSFCPIKCEVEDLDDLSNLHKLTICFPCGMEVLEVVPRLVNKTSKHLLYVSFKMGGIFMESNLRLVSLLRSPVKLDFSGPIEKFPDHRDLPYQLMKLVLGGSKLKEDIMATIEKLAYLEHLQLIEDAFVGQEMKCSKGGIPRLKFIKLRKLHCLEELRLEKEQCLVFQE